MVNDRDAAFFNRVIGAGGELAFSMRGGETLEFNVSSGVVFVEGEDENIYAEQGAERIKLTESPGQEPMWASLYFSRPDYVDTSDQGW